MRFIYRIFLNFDARQLNQSRCASRVFWGFPCKDLMIVVSTYSIHGLRLESPMAGNPFKFTITWKSRMIGGLESPIGRSRRAAFGRDAMVLYCNLLSESPSFSSFRCCLLPSFDAIASDIHVLNQWCRIIVIYLRIGSIFFPPAYVSSYL
jgi:hypothetical protein